MAPLEATTYGSRRMGAIMLDGFSESKTFHSVSLCHRVTDPCMALADPAGRDPGSAPCTLGGAGGLLIRKYACS